MSKRGPVMLWSFFLEKLHYYLDHNLKNFRKIGLFMKNKDKVKVGAPIGKGWKRVSKNSRFKILNEKTLSDFKIFISI